MTKTFFRAVATKVTAATRGIKSERYDNYAQALAQALNLTRATGVKWVADVC